MRTLLAAVDFSEPSKLALETAIGLAKQLDAQLHIVHALELPTPVFSTYSFQIPEYYLDTARTEARRLLEGSAKHAGDSGVDAQCHLAHQPPSVAIAEVANEIAADLVIVGTHGHTGIRHVALGSVAVVLGVQVALAAGGEIGGAHTMRFASDRSDQERQDGVVLVDGELTSRGQARRVAAVGADLHRSHDTSVPTPTNIAILHCPPVGETEVTARPGILAGDRRHEVDIGSTYGR